ncbi:twin-arginine translocase subunit TatC [Thermosulfurimonas sp. F29]|uniref:twin-arginine translocase subunit TatC n=1 Tax=Thermosulfurimonas sp. F29 TaxID=2867247 RepID=UPI001C839D2F|nr:twin-arginine translocase subunit TatC [Thermosulfurimonas sp. F29]MBX6422956.1 twin-arginine translocase subunit TatC [Thermosulfurimonas sp. F29]
MFPHRRELPRLPLEVHLAELRKRLIFCLAVLFFFWCLLFYLFPRLTPLLFWPYTRAMGEAHLKLVFTTLPEAIMAALKTTFFLALALTLPVISYHAWAYLSPGLYPEERRLGRRVLLLSFFLVVLGISLGYFVWLPVLLKFLLGFGFSHFEANLRLQNYLAFLGKTVLVSALVAEIPLAIAFLTRINLISRKILARKRWYILGGIYLLALFLVPGDFLSQVLIFMSFYLLMELGFILAKII